MNTSQKPKRPAAQLVAPMEIDSEKPEELVSAPQGTKPEPKVSSKKRAKARKDR